ncbi:hypothetical protein T261_1298 [Streptomyces lydicus]|nr:hypothetical protein T261_1298 [Streptomyces lydicus]
MFVRTVLCSRGGACRHGLPTGCDCQTGYSTFTSLLKEADRMTQNATDANVSPDDVLDLDLDVREIRTAEKPEEERVVTGLIDCNLSIWQCGKPGH